MSNIPAYLDKLLLVDAELKIVEAKLAQLKRDKNHLETMVLPALFTEARVSKWTTDSGATAIKSLMATGSLPKEPEERQQALVWLDSNGYGPMIEAKVTASWSRGHRERAVDEYRRLRTDNSAKVMLDEGMNHMTLGAQMKQRIQAGKDVPMSLLGVTILPRVRFTKQANGDDETA